MLNLPYKNWPTRSFEQRLEIWGAGGVKELSFENQMKYSDVQMSGKSEVCTCSAETCQNFVM